MYAFAIVLLLAVVAILELVQRRRRDAERSLRALFESADFIGRDVHYLLSKAGPCTYFGGMDHGREVAQWEAGRLVAEVWFQNGVCTEVDLREIRTRPKQS